MNRPRILFINPNSEIGGSDVSLLRVVRELDRTRFDPVVGLPGPGPLAPEFERMGVEVHYLSILPIKRFRTPTEVLGFLYGAFASLFRLRREMADIAPQVVHINSLVLLSPTLVAWSLRKPIVWHVREILLEPAWVSWLLTRIAVLIATRVLAISRAVRATFPRWHLARTEVVHNGVDLERFDPDVVDGAGIRRELGIEEGVPVVGFVGRLVPWKGADRFIRACCGVAREYPEARFVVVGSVLARYEGYVQELRDLVKGLGLGERVDFLYGRVDVPEILAGMDVFVHASVQPEPFGLVIVEAMAMGKAVVASRGGGVPEIIDEPEVGELVEPGDVEGIERAVVGLLGDRNRRESMGRAARQKVLREFDARREAASLERIYGSLVEK